MGFAGARPILRTRRASSREPGIQEAVPQSLDPGLRLRRPRNDGVYYFSFATVTQPEVGEGN
jgi:hypothetical protein